ncbi:iron complex outermembrane recepter protein [Paramixta manurensis]|uniref:Iron complex outermembrane recepter protein n=1 Tax=Paramixta manurensis TaxID=2740817 RepID=A0A6M8UHN5_9GAMM|nr:iron complex outermembrane recepter protein [Erwiniaceae bacterium PD-1]
MKQARDIFQGITAQAALLATVIGSASPMANAAENSSAPPAESTMVVNANTQQTTEDEGNAVAHVSAAATKTATPLIETPQSVSVVTQAQIATQAAKTIPQAVRYLAGVSAESSGPDTRFDTIYVRGFEADEYLDGLRLPREAYWSRPAWDPYLLSRIEVVKGPSSVLYGQANPGGIVNLVSKKPEAQPGGEVYLSAGNYHQFGTGFDVTGPLDDNHQLLGRVSGTFFNTQTQVDHSRYQHFDIAPSLTWQPDADTSLTVLAQLRRDPDSGFFNQQPVVGTLVHNPNGHISTHFYGGQPGLDTYSRNQGSIGYQFEHRFNDLVTVRQNLRYLSSSADYKMVYPIGVVPNAPLVNRASMNLTETMSNIALDNQSEWHFATGPLNHTVLAGVDYMHTSIRSNAGYGDASPINYLDPDYSTPVTLPDFTSRTHSTMAQTGAYLQDQLKWDRWVMNLGGRFDYAKTNVRDLVASSNSQQNDHATTGRAALLYHFDNGLAPYISYSTSFVPTSGSDFNGNAFKPTKGKQSEIGLKYDPLGLDALFTVALFDLRETNVATADLEHLNYSVQTGEIRSKGVELEGKINLTPDWLVLASYAYTDPEVVQSNNGDKGNDPVAISRNSARLWSEYSLHGALDGLKVGGGARYIGTSYANRANTLKVPAATVYDAMVSYRWRQWQMALNAENLTNKVYLASCQDNGCEYAIKRQYVATLSYQW